MIRFRLVPRVAPSQKMLVYAPLLAVVQGSAVKT